MALRVRRYQVKYLPKRASLTIVGNSIRIESVAPWQKQKQRRLPLEMIEVRSGYQGY